MKKSLLYPCISAGFYLLLSLIGLLLFGTGLIQGDFAEKFMPVSIVGMFCAFLVHGFTFRRVFIEEDIGGDIVRFLLGLAGLLGGLVLGFFTFICFVEYQSEAYKTPYFAFVEKEGAMFQVGLVGMSGAIAMVINLFLRLQSKLFPDRYRYGYSSYIEFFNIYGFIILFPSVYIILSILSMFLNVIHIFMFVVNVALIYVFVFLRLSEKRPVKILGYIIIGVVILFNLGMGLGSTENGLEIERMSSDLEHLFSMAITMFPSLTFVMCLPMYLLEEYMRDMGRDFMTACYLIFPIVMFGVQILMFFHYQIVLPILGGILVLILGIEYYIYKNL